jgi:hypothetical protein
MAEDSAYVLEPIREGTDFTLYRGRERGNPIPILAVAVAAEQPSPQALWRLEYECSLATELDAEWAAQHRRLTHHQGRTPTAFCPHSSKWNPLPFLSPLTRRTLSSLKCSIP